MSLSILFLIFIGYLLYRFVVGFVLPVTRTARGMKKQFDNMQQQAGYASEETTSGTRQQSTSSSRPQHSHNDSHQRTTSGRKGAKEDYIDFEEVPAAKY